jgi:hypothetical protein
MGPRITQGRSQAAPTHIHGAVRLGHGQAVGPFALQIDLKDINGKLLRHGVFPTREYQTAQGRATRP